MAATVNLSMDQGATWIRSFALKDGSGNPVDLTGATAAMMFRVEMADTPCLSLAIGTGLTIPTPANGVIAARVEAGGLPTFEKDTKLRHDFVLTQGGIATRIFQGVTSYSPGVTR